MSLSYEVLYFDSRGRAEAIRMVLALAGQTFTDTRFVRGQWANVKADMPLGQVPVLYEHEGDRTRAIPQSQAILRHLGRKHGLYGSNAEEHLAADVLADTCLDIRAKLVQAYRLEDPEAQAAFVAEQLPVLLDRLHRLLDRGPETGFFVGSQPTWADVVAFETLDRLLAELGERALADRADLAAFVARMREVPRLARYLEERAAAGR